MIAFRREGLGELGPRADFGAFPVEDVDRYCDQESQAAQNGGGPFELILITNVFVD